MTYVPLTYVQDVVALLGELGIERFAAIGTSLGGLVAMLMAATLPVHVVGAVLNDVGPELEKAGLERVRDSIGARGSQPNWIHAAPPFAELKDAVHPGEEVLHWPRMPKRPATLTSVGQHER